MKKQRVKSDQIKFYDKYKLSSMNVDRKKKGKFTYNPKTGLNERNYYKNNEDGD